MGLIEKTLSDKDRETCEAIRHVRTNVLYRPCEIAAFVYDPNHQKSSYILLTRRLRERIKYNAEPDGKVKKRVAWFGATWRKLLPLGFGSVADGEVVSEKNDPMAVELPADELLAEEASALSHADTEDFDEYDDEYDDDEEYELDGLEEFFLDDYQKMITFKTPLKPHVRVLDVLADLLRDRAPRLFQFFSGKTPATMADYRRDDVGRFAFTPGNWTVHNAPGLFRQSMHPSGLFLYLWPFWEDRLANPKSTIHWKPQPWETQYLNAYGYCCRNQFEEACQQMTLVLEAGVEGRSRAISRSILGMLRIWITLQNLHGPVDRTQIRDELKLSIALMYAPCMTLADMDQGAYQRFSVVLLEVALCMGRLGLFSEIHVGVMERRERENTFNTNIFKALVSACTGLFWELEYVKNKTVPKTLCDAYENSRLPLSEARDFFLDVGLYETAFFYQAAYIRQSAFKVEDVDELENIMAESPIVKRGGVAPPHWLALYRFSQVAVRVREGDGVSATEMSESIESLHLWPNPLQRFYLFALYNQLKESAFNDREKLFHFQNRGEVCEASV